MKPLSASRSLLPLALLLIVVNTQKQGGGVRTLIYELTQSRLFQTR